MSSMSSSGYTLGCELCPRRVFTSFYARSNHYLTVHGGSYWEIMAELRDHEAELADQASEVANQEFLDAFEALEVLEREQRAADLIVKGYSKAFSEAMRENIAELEAAIEAGMADPSNEEKTAYLLTNAYYEKMGAKYHAAQEELKAVSQSVSSAHENAMAALHKSLAAEEAAIEAHNQAAIAANQQP